MAPAITLRTDFDAAAVRLLARGSTDAGQARRLLALAVIYDGGSRSAAASVGGVTRQVVRDWVLRFNEDGAEGLIDRKAPGASPKLNDDQREALIAIVERGPYPAVDDVVRWRLVDLAAWIYSEFGITLDERTVSRTLKAAGYTRLTARPQHPAQNELAIEAFKKTSPPSWRRSAHASNAARR